MQIPQTKFIWQDTSPVPFESGWMIFAKLMLLNRLKPQEIVNLIGKQGNKDNRKLNFRSADWIDLDCLAERLTLTTDRLKLSFFDQLQIYFESTYTVINCNGIRVCNECLALGFHCVFFELGFINTCPWHHKQLEKPCINCLKAVHSQGLKFLDTNKYRSNNSLGSIFSDCGHIHFEIDNVKRVSHLSETEIESIKYKCRLLFGWIKIVQTRLDLTSQLFTNAHNPEFNDNLLNVAEQVAGPCPWPLDYIRRPVRWSQIKQNDLNHSSASINTIYRSLRKHIFNRFVKPHRSCYQSIIVLKRDQSLSICSDQVCVVALAYIAWRMKIENLINIEAISLDLSENFKKPKFEFFHPPIPIATKSQGQMMYVHFCWILDEIMRDIGKSALIITNSTLVSKSARTINWFKELSTLIYPDPEILEKKSWVHCACKNLKKYPEITARKIVRLWTYENHREMMSNHYGIMFRLTKQQISSDKHDIKYLNI